MNPFTSLSEAYTALRTVPKPVRELVVEIVGIILTAKNPALTARKAVEAIRTKAIDEALKAEFADDKPTLPSPREASVRPQPPPLPAKPIIPPKK